MSFGATEVMHVQSLFPKELYLQKKTNVIEIKCTMLLLLLQFVLENYRILHLCSFVFRGTIQSIDFCVGG